MTDKEQEELDKLKRDLPLYKESSEKAWTCASSLVKQLLIKDNKYLPKFLFDNPENIQEELEKALYLYLQNKFENNNVH